MRVVLLVLATLAAMFPVGCRKAEPVVAFSAHERAQILRHSPLAPLPKDPSNAVADDADAARLGQSLFFDTRLSRNGDLACASCHDPKHGFADGRRFGRGIATTVRHVPSLLNVAYNRWYFWDGRADSGWSQALQPLEESGEQGTSRLSVAHVVSEDIELRRAYERVFGELHELADERRFPRRARPVPGQPDDPDQRSWAAMSDADRALVDRVFSNVGKAIAAYERRIVDGDAPFDRFVEGLRDGDAEKLTAIDASAQRGLALFVGRANCGACHVGPNFTDGEFHDTGLARRDDGRLDVGRYGGVPRLLADHFNALGAYSDAPDDPDRLTRFVTPRPEHLGQFKTPTLRNVAATAPYMHDGRFATLAEVVRYYATLDPAKFVGHHRETILQPLALDDADIHDLVAFLESLTGQPLAPALTQAPESASASGRSGTGRSS